jgi:hypothetical protein
MTTVQTPTVLLSLDDLVAAVGTSRARVVRLVRLGVVEPTAPGVDTFTAATAARLRRMMRLHADLGVDFVAAAVILDLVQRLDRLEAELARVRGGADVQTPRAKEKSRWTRTG